jgi:glucoamylase
MCFARQTEAYLSAATGALEKDMSLTSAPGKPGEPATWAPADKSGVGTALDTASSVWFTLHQGWLTEVFYPFVDIACTRDMLFAITNGHDFFANEKHGVRSEIEYLASGVPGFRVTSHCEHDQFQLQKELLADPRRAVILQRVQFEVGKKAQGDLELYVVANAHLGNQGHGNSAWVGEFKGIPMLFARRNSTALALACSAPWLKRSVGYLGHSDGFSDLSQHKTMKWQYQRADEGNVVLSGQIDYRTANGHFVLALAFGRDEFEAGHRARASLLQGFQAARDKYVEQWTHWQSDVLALKGSKIHSQDLYQISAAVMRTHESQHFPGAIVASLSTPWGFAKGDLDYGYHLVWPRDMIETVAGLLAIEKLEDARRVLFYFQVTQEADGHWPQNMFLDGRHSWNGVQLDETAFVILLVALARRENALEDEAVQFLWPMTRAAAKFLVQHGPVTPMDRWEEQAGYFPSTMAVEIPALLAAAELAETFGEPDLARYLKETADAWNDSIEELLYVKGTQLATDAGVEGYYVRFAPTDQMEADAPAAGAVHLRNHDPGHGEVNVANIVSPDALCLVRFGLRAADDPRIVNTVRVIDHVLKVKTKNGPCWHRYSHDGYGEHEDGSPYDGTGIGRAWPLLTGERAHYELAAGRKDEAERLLDAMESFANASGLFPEQIWDVDDISEKGLYFGRPSGSAMPLVWAHAEYVKLRRSLHDGRVFDTPRQTAERYLKQQTRSKHAIWRFDQKRRAISAGKLLRLEVMAKATVRWSSDDWKTAKESQTLGTAFGIHFVDLPTSDDRAGAVIRFTFFWHDANRWEGHDFCVVVESARPQAEGPRPSTPHAHSLETKSDSGASSKPPKHKGVSHGKDDSRSARRATY